MNLDSALTYVAALLLGVMVGAFIEGRRVRALYRESELLSKEVTKLDDTITENR